MVSRSGLSEGQMIMADPSHNDPTPKEPLLFQTKKMQKDPQHSMEQFYFDEINVYDDHLQEFSDKGLPNQENITDMTLIFMRNQITDLGIKYLFQNGISKLNKIKQLKIKLAGYEYHPKNKTLEEMGRVLGELGTLQELTLEIVYPDLIDNEQFLMLGQGLAKLSNLLIFNFDFLNARISSECLQKFSEILFPSLKSLKSLKITSGVGLRFGEQSKGKEYIEEVITNLSDDAYASMLNQISKLSNLIKLSLNIELQRWNTKSFTALSKTIAKLTNLRDLCLNFQNFRFLNNENLEILAKQGLSNCKALQILFFRALDCPNFDKDGVDVLIKVGVLPLKLKQFNAGFPGNKKVRHTSLQLTGLAKLFQ